MILFKDHWWHERVKDSEALSRRLSGYTEEPLARVLIDGREYGFFRLTPPLRPPLSPE